MANEILQSEIIVCLYDGSYHLGIAALTNSLVKSGFKGLIHVGYRDHLPPWTNQLKALDDQNFYVTSDIVIHFRQVSTDMHLGYYKPYFLTETFDNYLSAKKLFYFDADIVVTAPWNLFSRWLETGVCLCLDNNFHFVHQNHPWRKDWKLLAGADPGFSNDTHFYFNSGFAGIERGSISLLHRWMALTDRFRRQGGDISAFVKDAFSSVRGDQDLLNAVITTSSDIQISVVGKDGMGFTPPATLMLHAIGEYGKPWDKQFVISLIKSGLRPTVAEKGFFLNCKFPIDIFSGGRYMVKNLDLKIASFLGRFIG